MRLSQAPYTSMTINDIRAAAVEKGDWLSAIPNPPNLDVLSSEILGAKGAKTLWYSVAVPSLTLTFLNFEPGVGEIWVITAAGAWCDTDAAAGFVNILFFDGVNYWRPFLAKANMSVGQYECSIPNGWYVSINHAWICAQFFHNKGVAQNAYAWVSGLRIK